MNIDIQISDYLLAWYLLYGASLSKEIDKFKKALYIKYKKEYNLCYKDRLNIIKDGKDYIPDNDVLYNAVFESELYKSLKKETNRHRLHICKLWDSNRKELNTYISDVLRITFPKRINLYIIHPRLEVIEYIDDSNSIIWGSDKDKYDALTVMLLTITKGIVNVNHDYEDICKSILELSIVNEIGERISHSHTYELGDPILKVVKRQIYPFWLMYLGYNEKQTILNKMIEDKVGFDLDKYPLDKNMKKLNLQQFMDFCVKNSKHILKINNIMKIEENIEVEII